MRILMVIAILWSGAVNAQLIDADAYTAELTSIAEKANLPGAYKGKVAIAFANYHNRAIKQYPREVVKVNALTNRVADAFSITFTLNGSTMESAQFPANKTESNQESAGDTITYDTSALDYPMERLADDDYYQNSLARVDDNVEIFKVVEEMPRFPGCEDIDGTNEQKQRCAYEKLKAYLDTNIRYEGRALAKGIEGRAVIQFNVQTDGSLTDISLVRGLGYGCDEESLRVVEAMNHMPEKWRPGMQLGKPVVVQFTLPINFPPK